MNEQLHDFQHRVGRISRAHSRRAPYAFTVRADGLVVPKTRSRLRFHFPWRAMLAGFVTIVMVKGFLLFYLGTEGYQVRMEQMLAGSEYQEAAATILMPDAVSLWTADRMRAVALLISGP